jgi:hypothetical protein
MSMDEHAMAAPVGGTRRDGNGGSSDSMLGSVANCRGRVTTGFGDAIHMDGDGKTSSGADRLAAEPIDWNRSYLIPDVMNVDNWSLTQATQPCRRWRPHPKGRDSNPRSALFLLNPNDYLTSPYIEVIDS